MNSTHSVQPSGSLGLGCHAQQAGPSQTHVKASDKAQEAGASHKPGHRQVLLQGGQAFAHPENGVKHIMLLFARREQHPWRTCREGGIYKNKREEVGAEVVPTKPANDGKSGKRNRPN
jgi:hypothetical protein